MGVEVLVNRFLGLEFFGKLIGSKLLEGRGNNDVIILYGFFKIFKMNCIGRVRRFVIKF